MKVSSRSNNISMILLILCGFSSCSVDDVHTCTVCIQVSMHINVQSLMYIECRIKQTDHLLLSMLSFQF